MNHEALIHGYLDGTLSEQEEAALNQWLKQEPGNAVLFADAARLHDRLHDIVCAATARVPASDASPARQMEASRPHPWRRLGWIGGLSGLAAALLLGVWMFWPPSVSAAADLNRLIESSVGVGDRIYRIHNLDSQPEAFDEKKPPIDGAMLYVRSTDQYVLVRQFPDGGRFITGSDGERSWSIPPAGPVRVSADPMRFRGPLPGNQHGVPFLDLRSDLLHLRESYNLTSLPAQANGWRGLVAEKKSSAFRGPRRIELRYDPRTGVIHQMTFAGMPRARGGPDSVSLDLSEPQPLRADFFQHQSHHGGDRQVIEED